MVALDSEAAGTSAVKQVQSKAALRELMELVSSVQQSRARVAVLERAALSCIKHVSKTCGSECDTAAFAKHEACWASHASLLRSWDEAVVADVTVLEALLQQPTDSKVCTEVLTSHKSSNVPRETKTLKLEAKDPFDTAEAENATLSGPSPKKPELTSEITPAAAKLVPSQKEPKFTNESTPAAAESTNVTWAGRIKASLSPNQTGAVGRAHRCKDKDLQSHKVQKTQANAANAAVPPLPVATSGTIVKLVRDRGFGFLAPEGGRGNIFFHASVCDTYLDAVKEGDRATFTITTQASGKAAATAVRVQASGHAAATAVRVPRPSPTAARQVAPVRTPHESTHCKTAKLAATKTSTVLQLTSRFQGLRVSRDVKANDRAAKPLPTKVSAGASPDNVAKPRDSVTNKDRAQQRNIQSSWPKPRTGEIELIIDEPWSYAPKQRVRSGSLAVQNFKFGILAFPKGTGSRSTGTNFGAFVEALPGDHVEPDSLFNDVCIEITAVNWSDFSKSRTKSTSFTFKACGLDRDRGWHEMLTMTELEQGSCWVGPAGSVCIRARCIVDDDATWS